MLLLATTKNDAMKKLTLLFLLLFPFHFSMLLANDVTIARVCSDKDSEEFHRIKHIDFPGIAFFLSHIHVVDKISRMFCCIKGKVDAEFKIQAVYSDGAAVKQKNFDDSEDTTHLFYEFDLIEDQESFDLTFIRGDQECTVKVAIDYDTQKITVSE